MNIFAKTCITAAIALTAGTASSEELRFSGAGAASLPWGVYLDKVGNRLAELSDGELTMKTFHSGSLGDENEVARKVARGRIDGAGLSNSGLAQLVPEVNLLAAPYLFDSRSQIDCFVDQGHLTDILEDNFTRAGVQVASWMEVGQQILLAKQPITHPDDARGVSIRTAPTVVDREFIAATGANPVPINTADSMSAIKTGMVDAVTWPAMYGLAMGYPEVAPHITTTNHSYQIGGVIIASRTWKRLSEQEREWVQEAFSVFDGHRDAVRETELALLKKAEKNGATIHRPSEEVLSEWRAVGEQAMPSIVNELGDQAATILSGIEEKKSSCLE